MDLAFIRRPSGQVVEVGIVRLTFEEGCQWGHHSAEALNELEKGDFIFP